MSAANSTLSTLVSTTPHLLAYSIPLLLVSVPLTFAGTFLTLDRSRSFPSSYAPVPLPGAFDGPTKQRKFTFSLEGGLGGLASGYVFGVHLSTFLTLLVPAISSSAPLSQNSFIAVWILSCVSTTILGGRYRYCARLFAAISGGSLLALAVAVITHPSLLPRQVLTGLFAGILFVLVFLFSLPRLLAFLRPTLRVATASSGAFSLVLSIALLSRIPAWADVWERLWLHDGENWGSSKEKGLSAAFCIIFCVGMATDWALNRWLGECPDEKWDKYLSSYFANLPNDASRAGNFKPLPTNTFWARLFGSPPKQEKDIIFPLSPPSNGRARNSMSKEPTSFLSDNEYGQDFAKNLSDHRHLPYDDLPASPGFLKKARSQNTKFKPQKKPTGFKDLSSGRKPIRFGENLSSDSSDDDSDRPRNVRPWLKQKASMGSSSPTLVEEPMQTPHKEYELGIELGKLKKARVKAGGETPDYSDYEEDLGNPKVKSGPIEGEAGWRPGFMERHSSSAGTSSSGAGRVYSSQNRSSLPMGAVPATPSLIKALDRISSAQRDAFGPEPNSRALTSVHPEPKRNNDKVDGLPKVQELDDDDEGVPGNETQRAPRWEEFWREVKHKAHT